MSKRYEYADVRFNSGNGALLCNECSIIIDYGFEHEDKEHFCEKCEQKLYNISKQRGNNMKMKLDVDIDAGLRPNGIEVSVYLGDTDTPFEAYFDFDEVIQTFIGYYTIRDKIQPRHAEEIQDVIDMLHDAAATLEHRLTEDLGDAEE